MIKTMDNMPESSFIEIKEGYPDEYILVKITKRDYSIGLEAGIVLALSDDEDELDEYSSLNNIGACVVLTGLNLQNYIGGLR